MADNRKEFPNFDISQQREFENNLARICDNQAIEHAIDAAESKSYIHIKNENLILLLKVLQESDSYYHG